MIVYIQQIRVAGWIRVVLSWLLLYMGSHGVCPPFIIYIYQALNHTV